MADLRSIVQTLLKNPRYVLMRSAARFSSVRAGVTYVRGQYQRAQLASYLADVESRDNDSLVSVSEMETFPRRLDSDGLALGLDLSRDTVEEITEYARGNRCYADRDPTLGFNLAQRTLAEERLEKPILVAQYFNTATECSAIAKLQSDPRLLSIAARYLRSVPVLAGVNLWWTFAVPALEADRDRHAHLFHRDVDDFRFLKFFFYLTDVLPGDGAHVCVRASHRRVPSVGLMDRWNIRRYSDREIELAYAPEQVTEICGSAGTGFAENTLCIHKGLTPTRGHRLILQVQFSLFDYGVMHDRHDMSQLRTFV